ncbi:DNA-methyltransferase [Georgenia muralis]
MSALVSASTEQQTFTHGRAELHTADCLDWLRSCTKKSIAAVVTDPPYGLHEYTEEQQAKLRAGRGGVWRIPPSFDGNRRAPLPRFTTMSQADLDELHEFFLTWALALRPALLPGAHVIIACNPLVSPYISLALSRAGLERRGEIVRLVQTMRGGDRPKNAHDEFPDVSVMARSQWEPWLLYREPIESRTVADNLRKYKTGGLRRISDQLPFGDVIKSSPTPKKERELAPHPSLKPQSFLRAVVRASLPLGEGVVLDPFAGAGSTLAAAEAVGYQSIGIERDPVYAQIARDAIGKLAQLSVPAAEVIGAPIAAT